MTPEQKARENIDKMLIEAGYIIQDMREINLTASLGVVVREFPTNSGEVDYLIFINGKPVGVIEAKEENKGAILSTVAEQSKRYAESGLKYYKGEVNIRFTYETTGVKTNFADLADDKYRSREVFSFHRPETLAEWLQDESTLRNRLRCFPAFNTDGFRQCQITAIKNLEESFADNKPRALIQMATGAGKTFTAITAVYRLLKFAKAKRVLFLVDTKNLGEQAEQEFLNYPPYDDGRKFPELYNVRRLNSSYIPNDTKVCISTIQRMYSILRGEEMDESAEQDNPNERKDSGKPRDVVYNGKYPPEYFDFIIIDECHRSIYNIWQQVLDYFDAFLIGLTAAPDSRTFGFFNKNVVSEYTHEQAVLDNVNVGRDGTYLIETEISGKGGTVLKGVVEKRERLTRKKRWEQQDEDVNYVPSQLDRDVVNPTQIRTIIQAFAKSWRKIFPTRQELPKTLVFAKTDSHADDIITIIREEFGEGNDFCKKVTYGADDPKSVLAAFRNAYYPRIAVTVDMIATGTDVKPIECLVFMRDVRSKNYFEQMLGRATRTLGEDDIKNVLDSFMIYTEKEINAFAKVFFKESKKQGNIDLATLNAFLDPAAERYNALTEEQDRMDFKGALAKFIRLYAFLTHIINLGDEKLYKFHAYAKCLLRKLPRVGTEHTPDLGSDVMLQYYRVQKVAEGSIVLANEDGVLNSRTSGTGLPLEDEKEALSVIIQNLNERLGTNFTEVDKVLEQFIQDMADNAEIVLRARNPRELFKIIYNDAIVDIVINRMAKNEDFCKRYLEDAEFRRDIDDYLLPIVHERLSKM